jgi:hypothetical protein
MCRSEGPSGSLCREMEIGMVGLRYFIRGSISRQNFLVGFSVSRVCGEMVSRIAGGVEFRGLESLGCKEICFRRGGLTSLSL